MAKQEKKSIADLIGKRKPINKPSLDEIENITQKIHQTKTAAPAPPVAKATPTKPLRSAKTSPKTKAKPATKKKVTKSSAEEKIKRISVNAPVTLYLKAKTKATLADQTLMGYILGLMEKDLS